MPPVLPGSYVYGFTNAEETPGNEVLESCMRFLQRSAALEEYLLKGDYPRETHSDEAKTIQ